MFIYQMKFKKWQMHKLTKFGFDLTASFRIGIR